MLPLRGSEYRFFWPRSISNVARPPDKTFSTIDIIRIWENNLDDREMNEVMTFFAFIVPIFTSEFDPSQVLEGLVEGPWGPIEKIFEALLAVRVRKSLRRLGTLKKIFRDEKTAIYVFEWIKHFERMRELT